MTDERQRNSPQPTAPRAASWQVWVAAALIIAAGVAAYANSLQTPFIFDDEESIVRNPTIRRLARIGEVLSPPQRTTVAGRPMVNLSLAICYAMGGLHVFPYHAMNLAVHILAALTLFGLVRRTLLLPRLRQRFGLWSGSATWLGLTVALLWLVHPLQTESVTYIIQRAESMAGLFCLLTLYLFVRGACAVDAGTQGPPPAPSREVSGTRPKSSCHLWYVGAAVACALGMGTKEVMASAPLLALLYDRSFLSGSFSEALRRRRGFYTGLAATWLVLLAELADSNGHSQVIGLHFAELTPLHYGMTQCRFLIHYLALAFWPSDLVFDYGMANAGVPIIRTWAECAPWGALVLVLLCGTLLALRYLPEAGFLGAWFFLILAPTSSFVPNLSQVAAEHRMYLPLAAVVVGVVCGSILLFRNLVHLVAQVSNLRHRDAKARQGRQELSPLHPSTSSPLRSFFSWRLLASWRFICLVAAAGLAVLLFLGLTWRTIQRNRDYASTVAMWTMVVEQRPNNARAQNGLGYVLSVAGRQEEAIAQYRKAIEIIPDFAEAHYNLGNALGGTGQLEEAIAQYRKAIEIRPDYADAVCNLGVTLFVAGRLEEAIAQYRKAIEIRPDYADAHSNLGNALGQAGRLEEAIAHFRKAIEINPDYEHAHYNLGIALGQAGRLEEAIAHFRKAIEIKPDYADALSNLGVTLLMAGRPEEAIAPFRKAIEIEPDNANAHSSLAITLEKLGRSEESATHAREAARLRAAVPK